MGNKFPWPMGARAGGPLLGGGGFSPVDIPGLEFWFDASDASSFTLTGSEVDEWRDKTSNGYILEDAEILAKPERTTDSGFDAVLFDPVGTADRLITDPSAPNIPSSPCTRFIVFRAIATGSFYFLFDGRVGGSQVYFQMSTSGAVTCQVTASSGTNSTVNSTNQGTARSFLIDRHEGGQPANVIDANDNEVTQGSASGTLSTPINRFSMGGLVSAGQELNGYIFEMGHYSVRITDEERTSLSDYLKSKYSLP